MIYCKYGINKLKYDVQCKPGILHTSDVTHAGDHFISSKSNRTNTRSVWLQSSPGLIKLCEKYTFSFFPMPRFRFRIHEFKWIRPIHSWNTAISKLAEKSGSEILSFISILFHVNQTIHSWHTAWLPEEATTSCTKSLSKIIQPKIRILEFVLKNQHTTHFLKLVGEMCKYEIVPATIVADTEQTWFCQETGRLMDGWTEGRLDIVKREVWKSAYHRKIIKII